MSFHITFIHDWFILISNAKYYPTNMIKMNQEVILQLSEKCLSYFIMCLVFYSQTNPFVALCLFICSHSRRNCWSCPVDRTNLLAYLLYAFTPSTVILSNMNVVFCLTLPDTRQNIAWLSVSSLARLF